MSRQKANRRRTKSESKKTFSALSAVPTRAPHSFDRTLIWIGIWPLAALQPSTVTLTPKTSLPEASCRNRPRNISTFAETELLPELRQPVEKMA
jgi:hypothetical protein